MSKSRERIQIEYDLQEITTSLDNLINCLYDDFPGLVVSTKLKQLSGKVYTAIKDARDNAEENYK